ncbi:MAG: UDP-N-acetylmuramoyl-L-alanine--D-glutamate ligase [Wujia sp.]
MFKKKVLVAGAGKSGISASALLARNNINVILFDENEKLTIDSVSEKLQGVANRDKIEIHIGALTEKIINSCDTMIISPGIPVDAPFALRVKNAGIKIISEIELAFMFEKGQVAAITGTNGKTTTTTLVGEILKAVNKDTYVVGNIGYPYTDIADKTSAASVTVAEISSFQLETIDTFAPHVSAILNITPDHLNRHYTFDNYAACKLAIAENQTESDVCVLNYDDPETRARAERIRTRVVLFSRLEKLDEGVFVENGDIVIKEGENVTKVLSLKDVKLLGTHNTENILAAVAVSYYMGVPVSDIARVCTEFMGVEHRIEYVKTVKGVRYYNDSKGTNPDAAIKGIQAMDTTTFLIGGGYDKHSEYDEWIESFDGKVKSLVLIGQTAEKIAECARRHGFTEIVLKDSLEAAIEYCYENSTLGDAVLLSPACASWGMFENYEQRGDMFKDYVRRLRE